MTLNSAIFFQPHFIHTGMEKRLSAAYPRMLVVGALESDDLRRQRMS